MSVTNISIATGGVAETILAAGPTTSVMITATTENGWLNFGATAAVNTGIPVFVNTPLILNAQDFPDIAKSWSYFSATTAAKVAILNGTTP